MRLNLFLTAECCLCNLAVSPWTSGYPQKMPFIPSQHSFIQHFISTLCEPRKVPAAWDTGWRDESLLWRISKLLGEMGMWTKPRQQPTKRVIIQPPKSMKAHGKMTEYTLDYHLGNAFFPVYSYPTLLWQILLIAVCRINILSNQQ